MLKVLQTLLRNFHSLLSLSLSLSFSLSLAPSISFSLAPDFWYHLVWCSFSSIKVGDLSTLKFWELFTNDLRLMLEANASQQQLQQQPRKQSLKQSSSTMSSSSSTSLNRKISTPISTNIRDSSTFINLHLKVYKFFDWICQSLPTLATQTPGYFAYVPNFSRE